MFSIKNRSSITRRLLVPMLIIVIVQVVFLTGTIYSSGIIKILRDNSFNILNQKIESRKNYLENEMVQHWSNISESETLINSTILEKLKRKGLTVNDLHNNSEITSELLNDVSSNVVFMLRKNYVTGAFLVLDTDSEEKPGVYFRDLDPNSNPSDNSDLLMEKGPASIARNLSIPLDSLWDDKFAFNGKNKLTSDEFLKKPVTAAKENKNLSYKDLGYWSRPFELNEKDVNIITYSIPLLDDNNKPYGVLGIAVSLNYLNSLLDYKEIDSNGKGAYLLGIGTNDSMDFYKVMTTGPMANNILGDDERLILKNNEVYKSIYEIEGDNSNETAYACTSYLRIYNTNTPFENDRWAVMGIIEKKDLLYYYDKFTKLLVISLIISGIAGILAAFLAGGRVIKPIRGLAEEVKKSNPREPLALKKINISEIDELASAIVALNRNALDSASKLSEIIKLFNMPIGAFERKQDQDMVFCTETFFKTIGMEGTYNNETYVPIKEFEKIIEEIIVHEENQLEDIYRIERENNKIIWIKLKILEYNSKILGVVSDVTQDVLDKQKIEYERDYDILTDILNRRAFYRIVQSKLNKTKDKIGAFIMWDLDNLKYVNDTYGHNYGDEYIRRATMELKKIERYGGIVGRRSGDEFFVFMYGYESKDEIRKIIKDIHNNIENTIIKFPNNGEFKIRISAGVAWFPDDAITFEDLSRYSDFAMYKIKKTIKGNVNEFNMDEYNEESFLLSSHEDFNKILDQKLIKYAFQPIVDAKTGEVFAYEALMRSELESLKNPLHIIKIATADSRLYEIEKITFFKALEEFSGYMDKVKNIKLFINSIPNHALSDDDTKKFEKLYGKYLDRLVIELLENERSNGINIVKKRTLIEKWNAQLAIDDFGSGYNNEAVLLDVTPNFVKIDMEIVRGIDSDLNRQQISKNLITYAKQRNIKIVAEGVETREEMEKLIELGVDYLQGYYFSRPAFNPPLISDTRINEILSINNDIKRQI